MPAVPRDFGCTILRTRSGYVALVALASTSLVACIGVAVDDVARNESALDVARAREFTLWVHGYSPLGETKIGDYHAFEPYFGRASGSAGAEARAVNWGGRENISLSNRHVRNALDCFCTGTQFCAVVTHSAGEAQIGYALAHYNTTTRTIRDASRAASDGTCAPAADGGTQIGWNVRWVISAGGASGGSELAPIGKWLADGAPLKALKHGVLEDLNPTRMRTLYDHNDTGGKRFFLYAGANGALFSRFLLPGQDDQVVAYHSSGGISSIGAYCNPGEWFMCDGALTEGTGPASNGVSKWSEHEVVLLDTKERYSHHLFGAWRGIVGAARAYVMARAGELSR